MEVTRISGAQEFYVFQNSKKTLAVRNNLQLAVWDVFSRIHNPGGRKGKDKNGDGYPSTVKFIAIETGDKNSKSVAFNLTPADIRLLFFKLERLHKDVFEWSADRLHSFDKGSDGSCPMYRMSISRIPKNGSGEPYRSPWFVKIMEGTATPVETQTGSIMAKKGSWKEKVSVTIMLSDDEYYRCLSSCVRAIELWEMAYAIPHIKTGDILIQIARAKASAVDENGVLTLTEDKAKKILIAAAYAILDQDVQTHSVVKEYNNLQDYFGKLLDKDFSAFKLQTKKASV